MEILLNKIIKESIIKIDAPSIISKNIDTRNILYKLASAEIWTDENIEEICFLFERFDISKKLFNEYNSNGYKCSDIVIDEKTWLDLTAALFLKKVLFIETTVSTSKKIKQFNVVFKALEIIKPSWLERHKEFYEKLNLKWHLLLQSLPVIDKNVNITNHSNIDSINNDNLTTIPLTILYHEGPIGRAYLETINSIGYKPERIIELIPTKDAISKKQIGKWLPITLRESYLSHVFKSKIHYWPKNLIKSYEDIYTTITEEISNKLGFLTSTINKANLLKPIHSYCDSIIPKCIEDLADDNLHKYLSKNIDGAILYTGGGIMPNTLINLENIKFIHIHPGYLPNIRGADCALWSPLLTDHTSATCFYMASGIDTGDIIKACWLPKLDFKIYSEEIEAITLYRMVYSFIDPWIRAFVLMQVLKNNSDFYNLDTTSQSNLDGETFHFMHDRVKKEALKKLL